MLIGFWALRLGIYIACRVARGPEDTRYVLLRESWGAAFAARLFWFLQLQAVCAIFLGVSILVAARNPAPNPLLDLWGVAVLIVAILGEAVADRQLAGFKADPKNKGRICERGLWSWSRHPNYFFEWLGWWAYPILAVAPDYPMGWLAAIGPLLMYLILAHGTGVPPLEEHLLRSRGLSYKAYQRRTNAFIPGPPRR